MSTDLAPNSRWQEVQQQVGILGRSEAIRRLLETIEQVGCVGGSWVQTTQLLTTQSQFASTAPA